jgi:hypothetical protein
MEPICGAGDLPAGWSGATCPGELIPTSANWNASCTDCAGVVNGNAKEDNCTDCLCGNQWGLINDAPDGLCIDEPQCSYDCTESAPDCADNLGLWVVVDDVGRCWGGLAVEDECDVCDRNNTNNCSQNCVGDWGGDDLTDGCGVCDGIQTNDNDTCTGCTDNAEIGTDGTPVACNYSAEWTFSNVDVCEYATIPNWVQYEGAQADDYNCDGECVLDALEDGAYDIDCMEVCGGELLGDGEYECIGEFNDEFYDEEGPCVNSGYLWTKIGNDV